MGRVKKFYGFDFSRISKQGSSLIVVIPVTLARELELEAGMWLRWEPRHDMVNADILLTIETKKIP